MEKIRSWFPSSRNGGADSSRNSSSVASEEKSENYRPGGYHPVHLGELFNNRYQVISKLGYGVYSTVWLAKDVSSRSPHHVALKILTADSYGGSNPVYELDILRHISRTDPTHSGYRHVVHLLDSFTHGGPNGVHLCLVLELMGQSVLNLQKCFPNRRLPGHLGRQIAKQVLLALDWLRGSCGVIHTDIKPDNILIEIADVNAAVDNHLTKLEQAQENCGLMSQAIVNDTVSETSKLNIRITDFGVASWRDNHLSEWIQPPFLRAPEVILGAPWDDSVDVWGFACVIYELIQGRMLFHGKAGPNDAWTAEEDQIAQMIELFGPIPASLRNRGSFSSDYFDEDGELLHIKQLYPYSLRKLLAQTTNPSMAANDYEKFEAFLEAMLKFEPGDRKTPKALLNEPWISNEI